MKKKLLKHIVFLFILQTFGSCVNEMDMIEDVQDLETNSGQLYVSNPIIERIIDYGGVKPSDDVLKVVRVLDLLYRSVPQVKVIVEDLIRGNLKFRICVEYIPGSPMKSWYKSSNPPEIGFSNSIYITDAGVLHELLHFYTTHTYKTYMGRPNACEEYEVRVLTDLIMCKYYKNIKREYQGMRPGDKLYVSYKEWIDNIIKSVNYDEKVFKIGMQMYGAFCIMNFARDDRPGIAKLNEEDLNSYSQILLRDFWFNYKR